MIRKILRGIIFGVISLTIIGYFYFVLPLWGYPFNAQRHGNPPLTPAWALECWLWEDDVNTSDYVDELRNVQKCTRINFNLNDAQLNDTGNYVITYP